MKKLGIFIAILIGITLVIVFMNQSKQTAQDVSTIAPVSDNHVPIKKVKLVRNLGGGRQEVTEFDCSGILTRSTVSKNIASNKEASLVNDDTLHVICTALAKIDVNSLQTNYGTQEDPTKGYAYSLTFETDQGIKTIYIYDNGQSILPSIISTLITELVDATGTPLTPTPALSSGGITQPTPTQTQSFVQPTPTTIVRGPTPTQAPLICNYSLTPGVKGPRPNILSNTVCN